MNNLITTCPELKPVLEELFLVSGYLWEKGWAERNAGNLSVDVTEIVSDSGIEQARTTQRALPFNYPLLANRYFLVTGSGRKFRDLARDPARNTCILRISENGSGYRIVWGGASIPDFRPTSEFPTHLRLHEYIREAGATERVVLHTHPTELIVLTHLPEYRDEASLNRALWCVHPEVKVNLPRGVDFVPYAIPGSESLARATADGFRRGRSVVLWEMHGCVAKAESPAVAFDLIDVLNKAASIVLKCRSVGHVPTGLGKEQIDELAREFNLGE
ncbi:rhamnulose-1-phosphate aldolase [Candidatus Poribacteria bacterium]|nr:rhamnulose-1-phosphate aldolase [Candidatus Poribacteria bacterium]